MHVLPKMQHNNMKIFMRLMGPRHLKIVAVVFAVWVIIGGVYLSCGVRSMMPSYEGYLVSASRYRQCTSDDCGYYVNERFLIHGNDTEVDSAHCTVTRMHKYFTKKAADKAVRKVELGTTRTVWLRLTNYKVCYDASETMYNYVIGVIILVVGGMPILLLFCYYLTFGRLRKLWFGARERNSNSNAPADNMSPYSRSISDDGDVEMADGVTNNAEASPTEHTGDGAEATGGHADAGSISGNYAAITGGPYVPGYSADIAGCTSDYNVDISHYDSDAAYANKARL
jgi:hypothetical protein